MRERRVLYTVEEAAHLLGISPSTVHRWAREGELRTIPLSGRMVVPASALEQLLGHAHDNAGARPSGAEEHLNEVSISGRLVADAEVRESRKGLRYTTIKLSLHGPGPSKEPFHVVVVAFGADADAVADFVPGTLIRVDGRLAQRQWTAVDGTRLGVQRIVAERIRALETASVAP